MKTVSRVYYSITVQNIWRSPTVLSGATEVTDALVPSTAVMHWRHPTTPSNLCKTVRLIASMFQLPVSRL